MSEKKRTKHFGALIIDEVLQLRKQGKTKIEIAELFQLRNVKSVWNFSQWLLSLLEKAAAFPQR